MGLSAEDDRCGARKLQTYGKGKDASPQTCGCCIMCWLVPHGLAGGWSDEVDPNIAQQIEPLDSQAIAIGMRPPMHCSRLCSTEAKSST